MRRKFSMVTFIRMVPHSLLRAILKELKVTVVLPPVRKGVFDSDACQKAIDRLGKRDLDRVEDAFRAIDDMAQEGGETVLIEADQQIGKGDLSKRIPRDSDSHYWAAWSWVHRRDVFKKAHSLHHVSHLPSWRIRTDLPKTKPDLSRPKLRQLGKQFSQLLLTAQDRGRQCTVESLSWHERFYLFAHPDDYIHAYLAHTPGGRLNRKMHRPTFDFALAYDQASGKLETGGKLPPKLKDKLDCAFAKVCLEHDLGPYRNNTKVALARLIDPAFAFATDPADEMTVKLRKLSLKFPDNDRQIDLINDRTLDGDMTPLLQCLNSKQVVLAAMYVVSARIQFTFATRPVADECTRTIQLTAKSCSLRDMPEWQAELIQKCLESSGIVVTSSNAQTSQ